MKLTTNQEPRSTLIHGVDLISKKFSYCLNPMNRMYQFNSNPPYTPKPLSLIVALSILSCLIGLFTIDFLAINAASTNESKSEVLRLAMDSVFFIRLFKFYEGIRLTTYVSIILTALYNHGNIANVIAQNNNIVSDTEQAHIANISFTIFLFKTICNCITFSSITYCLEISTNARTIFGTIVTFFLSLCSQAPLIYVCYFGTALGKHIENFSQLHIDTLFDQCVKTKELLDNNENNSITNDIQIKKSNIICIKYCCCCCGFMERFFSSLGKFICRFWRALKNLCKFLNYRKYPELPEMKMTKLSSKIEISDTMRVTNSHLIRIRLRKTQIMLSELRDTVCDINKMSSPIIVLKLIQDGMLIVLIATGSIQARAYRSISFAMIPTISHTISLACSTVYICTCLDYTTSQLKLMINKLFDFIIMNHRVDNSDSLNSGQLNPLMTLNQLNRALQSSSSISYLSDKEDETLSETWSQFQYTRKLANTIQFTIGGILTASRRLVFPILGHILSAVFIGIEIMSIIDTSKDSKGNSESNSLNGVLNNINNQIQHKHI